jgi:hypothetical protein
VSLSPSLGRIQPWPGVKPFTPLNFFQQVIPITKTYCREDLATLHRTNSVHIIPAACGLAHNATEDKFDDDEVDAQQRRRLLRHRQGMGGNGPYAPEQDNDPYAEIKFSILPFYGSLMTLKLTWIGR